MKLIINYTNNDPRGYNFILDKRSDPSKSPFLHNGKYYDSWLDGQIDDFISNLPNKLPYPLDWDHTKFLSKLPQFAQEHYNSLLIQELAKVPRKPEIIPDTTGAENW